jgi:coenzyme Q-binding protein COQ10
MVVAYKVFRERFRSQVHLDRKDCCIDVEYIDGPFRTLKNSWKFSDRSDGGSSVEFYIEFEFRNFVLHATALSVFEKAFAKMSEAFVTRAVAIYGDNTTNANREMPKE